MDHQTALGLLMCVAVALNGAMALGSYRSWKEARKVRTKSLEHMSIYKRRIAYLRDKYPDDFFLDDLLDEMTNNPDLKD